MGNRLDARHTELHASNAQQLLQESAVVVDAFDNREAREAIGQAAMALHIRCLHIALGGRGDYGCGLWDQDYITEGRTPAYDGCNYPLTRPLVLLVVAAAAEVIHTYLTDRTCHGFEVTLRDLHLWKST